MNLSELRTALQERREDYSQSDAKLNRRINQAYLEICSRRRWGWLRRRHTQTTYAPIKSSAGVGFSVAGSENGKREISVTGAETPTSLGKRIRIENDFYRVVSIDESHSKWMLDRPLRCTASGTHYIDVYYNEVALPVGTLNVVESVLFRGGATTYGTPLSMGAIGPEEMAYLDMDVEGRPSSFATVRKEPLPPPKLAPTLTKSTGSGLSLGTYKYWYTYVDKQTGAESALGPYSSVEITSVVPAMQRVTVGTDNARTDLLLRLYRSTANGDVPYLLLDDEATSISGHTDAISDEYLTIRGPESSSTLYMQLYPVPDEEYEIRSLIQMEPSSLSADNDYPLFDSQFHHVILSGAEALMLEAADEQGRANQARQRFEAGIARMIALDRMNQQRKIVFGGARQLRGKPTWWYGSVKTT